MQCSASRVGRVPDVRSQDPQKLGCTALHSSRGPTVRCAPASTLRRLFVTQRHCGIAWCAASATHPDEKTQKPQQQKTLHNVQLRSVARKAAATAMAATGSGRGHDRDVERPLPPSLNGLGPTAAPPSSSSSPPLDAVSSSPVPPVATSFMSGGRGSPALRLDGRNAGWGGSPGFHPSGGCTRAAVPDIHEDAARAVELLASPVGGSRTLTLAAPNKSFLSSSAMTAAASARA